jgi:Xaa-Pro aminopeptidase
MQTKTAVTRPKAYLKERHKNVRQALVDLKLDGLLLTHPPDLTYLTNFTGDDSVGLITPKGFFIATDFRYQEQVAIEAGWLKIAIREGRMSEALAGVIEEAKAKRIGYEANFTTVGQIDALQRALKAAKLDNVELVPLEDVMVTIRKVKDDHEVALIRKSIAVAEEAFDAVRGEIKVGLSENYLAGLLGFEMRSRGASNSSFETIVATGANSSLPHYRPGETLVQRDAPLLFDWGARVNGYCSDLTRTLLLGRVSAKIKQIYKTVLEAQLAAIDFLRPGVTTRQADTVARDIIRKAGYDQYFGHGLGHGIGLEIHELPTLRKAGDGEELRPGMIVTVEPGIYLPGVGGVRIEDDVLITHSGCEVLTTIDKTLESCHIE